MSIALHHFFLLTSKPDELATEISRLGLIEGSSNIHPGQGTASRRFFLPGSALEILYIRDTVEALQGRAADLRFCERTTEPHASPFGLIVENIDKSITEPFPGWRYYPKYFGNEMFFHVGENSELLVEPLCICMPSQLGRPDIPPSQQNPDWAMTELLVRLPIAELSPTLKIVSQCKAVSLILGEPYQMEIVFNDHKKGQTKNLMPDFPLAVSW